MARRRLAQLPVKFTDLPYAVRGINRLALQSGTSRESFQSRVILSAKFDGFGNRLWNILNAWRVATSLGAQMRFYWPERNISGYFPADAVFNPEFLNEHLVEEFDASTYRNVRVWRPSDVHHLRGGIQDVWYESKHRDPAFDRFEVASRGFSFPSLPAFREAFSAVRLHPRLERVRAAVESQPRYKLAIHVRRGDVFDGDFRLGNHFVKKAIPLPLVERLIQSAEGGRVLLVGNDLSGLQEIFSKHENVATASSVLGSEDDELFELVRDFCLLTHCDQIIAGDSLFAVLPALIGRGYVSSVDDAISRDEQSSLLKNFVERHSGRPDLEVALAANYLASALDDRLTHAESERLLAASYAADPANPTSVLAWAARLIAMGDRDEASVVFSRAAAHGVPRDCLRLIRNSATFVRGVGFGAVTGGFLEPASWRAIESFAAADAWAGFYSALKHADEGSDGRARALLTAAARLGNAREIGDAMRVLEECNFASTVRRHPFAFSTDPTAEEGISGSDVYTYSDGVLRASKST